MTRLFDAVDGLSSETVLVVSVVLLVAVVVSDRIFSRRWSR